MNISIDEQKKIIREKCKTLWKNLNIKDLSKQIMNNLFSLDVFKNAESIFCYISFKNEIDTSQILDCEKKKIYVPKIDDNNMYMTEYMPQSLVKNKFGILEPKICNPVIPSKNDIIIVPALACDLNFFRIGYGKGYYDKYLKDKKVVKIIPLPSILIADNIPHDINDIPVDIIVTENSILKRV